MTSKKADCYDASNLNFRKAISQELWRKSGGKSGGHTSESRRLGGRGVGYEEEYGDGLAPPLFLIFHLKWRVLMHSGRYFLFVCSPEKC